METDFNPQESEFQETDNQLNQEEGQLDGTGSWDDEETNHDPLEDHEEAEDHNDDSDANGGDEEGSEDPTGEEDEDDPINTDETDSDDESEEQKNTPDGNSHRVLSFEDYFRN
jgi:hypothetical protein